MYEENDLISPQAVPDSSSPSLLVGCGLSLGSLPVAEQPAAFLLRRFLASMGGQFRRKSKVALAALSRARVGWSRALQLMLRLQVV